MADAYEIDDTSPVVGPSNDTEPATVVVTPAKLASPMSFARENSIPTLIYLERNADGIALCYLTCHIGMRECRVSWFLIHTARVLYHLSLYNSSPSTTALKSGILDDFVFHGIPDEDRFAIFDLRSFPPDLGTVPMAFRAWARFNPLATAVALYAPEGHILRTVSYGGLFALSLRIARSVRSIYAPPMNLALAHHDSPIAAISGTLAVLLAGFTLVVASPENGSLPEDTVLLDVTQHATPKLFENPDQLLHQNWSIPADTPSQLTLPATSHAAVIYPHTLSAQNHTWKTLSHETLEGMFMRRYWQFGRDTPLVSLLGYSWDYPRLVFMMESFFVSAAILVELSDAKGFFSTVRQFSAFIDSKHCPVIS